MLVVVYPVLSYRTYPRQIRGHEVCGPLHIVWILVRLHHVLGREPLVVRVADGARSDQQVPHQQLWVATPAFAGLLSMTVKKVNMSCILDQDVQEILDIDENILVGLGGIGIGIIFFVTIG